MVTSLGCRSGNPEPIRNLQVNRLPFQWLMAWMCLGLESMRTAAALWLKGQRRCCLPVCSQVVVFLRQILNTIPSPHFMQNRHRSLRGWGARQCKSCWGQILGEVCRAWLPPLGAYTSAELVGDQEGNFHFMLCTFLYHLMFYNNWILFS